MHLIARTEIEKSQNNLTHKKSDHSSPEEAAVVGFCGTRETECELVELAAEPGGGGKRGAWADPDPRFLVLEPGGGGSNPIPPAPDVCAGFLGLLLSLPAMLILIVSPSLKLRSSFGAGPVDDCDSLQLKGSDAFLRRLK